MNVAVDPTIAIYLVGVMVVLGLISFIGVMVNKKKSQGEN